MARLKVAILISGRGSNMDALVDACRDASYPAEIVLVASNNPAAEGLRRAACAGIPTVTVPHKGRSREAFEAELETVLRGHGAELVCLAGFMRLLTESFVRRWQDRILNVHPSLLPAYKGLDVHARVLADGVRFSGCTVHLVRPEMDTGPILVQAAVPVHQDDTPDTLATRVLAAEHKAYPLALKLLAGGRAVVDGDRVSITGAAPPGDMLLNPAV